jgi:hypothetical protein
VCRQIHRQKGNLLRNIDPAELRFILQAVEGLQATVDSRDVAGVQVAVALANKALLVASHQDRSKARQFSAQLPGALPRPAAFRVLRDHGYTL